MALTDEERKARRRERNRRYREAHPERRKEYYWRNRERQIAASQAYYQSHLVGTFEKKMRSLLYKAKQRAKAKGIPFSITMNDLKKVAQCPVFGVKLQFSNGNGDKDDSPSIDRIDPSRGYVPGNVWVISKRANQIKSDATLAELETLVSRLREVVKRKQPDGKRTKRVQGANDPRFDLDPGAEPVVQRNRAGGNRRSVNRSPDTDGGAGVG